MNQVREVTISLPHEALSDADWADAYQTVLEKPFPNARAAAEAIVAAFPKWTYPMLGLRQLVVAPFGLKGAKDAADSEVQKIGFFPVVSETDDALVAGFDDKHLDFRILVTIEKVEGGQSVQMATLIKRHNFLGRAYLQTVLPFHKAIIKGALGRL